MSDEIPVHRHKAQPIIREAEEKGKVYVLVECGMPNCQTQFWALKTRWQQSQKRSNPMRCTSCMYSLI